MNEDENAEIENNDDKLMDYLGKTFLINDNFFNILALSDENFSFLQKSLNTNPNYPKNPTREQLVAEKTTAMLFQLSVGYLYNLTEVIRFLKKYSYCDDLFESNQIFNEFDSNSRLICELRNNIVFHGSVIGNDFRGIQHVLDDLGISTNDYIKKIWICLRCGLVLTRQILDKFSHMKIKENVISKSMFSEDQIEIIPNYFDAKKEFQDLMNEDV